MGSLIYLFLFPYIWLGFGSHAQWERCLSVSLLGPRACDWWVPSFGLIFCRPGFLFLATLTWSSVTHTRFPVLMEKTVMITQRTWCGVEVFSCDVSSLKLQKFDNTLEHGVPVTIRVVSQQTVIIVPFRLWDAAINY